MTGSKYKGILTEDPKLWNLHITDMTSKGKLKSKSHVLGGWFNSIQMKNTGTTKQENSRMKRTQIPQAQQ
jgi:hypothetical protein